MKQSNIYGIGFFCLIVICFVPALAEARPIPPDPPPSPYSFPHSYTLLWGTVTGGYVWWTHIDDGNTFDIRAHWYWFISFFFSVEIQFHFTAHRCSKVYLEYSDNSFMSNGNANIYAHYTSGSPTFLGSFHEGDYTINLDSSRYLVKIWIVWNEASGWAGDRYVKFDYLVAEKV